MKHTSFYGTTCWFCGQPAAEGKGHTLQQVVYKICRPCVMVDAQEQTMEAKRERLRSLLNADVDGLQTELLHGVTWQPHYWTPAEYKHRLSEFRNIDPRYANTLRWKEYADEFAAGTEARLKE